MSQVYSFCVRGWPNTSHFLDKNLLPWTLTALNSKCLSTLRSQSGDPSSVSGLAIKATKHVVRPEISFLSSLDGHHVASPKLPNSSPLPPCKSTPHSTYLRQFHYSWHFQSDLSSIEQWQSESSPVLRHSTRIRKIRRPWSLDIEIEAHVKSWVNCAETAKDPTKTPLHQWDFPAKPWQWLYIDFAGAYRNKMWMLLIDAQSKYGQKYMQWIPPQQKLLSNSCSKSLLHMGFLTRLCQTMVPNSQQRNLSSSVGLVIFTTTAPYHPHSSGDIERFVQTFKQSVDKANPVSFSELQDCVLNFLACYRAAPHLVTDQNPSEMLKNRRMHTRLGLLHPANWMFRNLKNARSRHIIIMIFTLGKDTS